MKILQVQNRQVMVDDESFDELSKHPWTIGHNGYVEYKYGQGDKTIVIRIHRHLMGVTDSKIEVDHKDFNRLNNQKFNLRIATRQQNSYNKYGNGLTSDYKGVSFSKGKYRAFINNNYKTIYLMSSDIPDECGYAYNIAATIIAKEFAYLNKIVEQDLSKYEWIKLKVEEKIALYVSK